MAIIHRGATLTPSFHEFLPGWLAERSWFQGTGVPASLIPVGYFRFEDPAGVVGIETHLVKDGSVVYQVPMTYRPCAARDVAEGLIATAEHSVLGTRWIYDAEYDPVWVASILRLIRTGGVSEPSGRRGVAPAEARGCQRNMSDRENTVIELNRVLQPGPAPDDQNVLGHVMGTWHLDDADTPPAQGCLVTIR